MLNRRDALKTMSVCGLTLLTTPLTLLAKPKPKLASLQDILNDFDNAIAKVIIVRVKDIVPYQGLREYRYYPPPDRGVVYFKFTLNKVQKARNFINGDLNYLIFLREDDNSTRTVPARVVQSEIGEVVYGDSIKVNTNYRTYST